MDKQRALLDGAQRVFARDGYSRASIQTLATEAGVSTRTIYNQYGNKENLFRAVIIDSANRVADRQIDQVGRAFSDTSDLREALIRFGVIWSIPDEATASHFALVRQVHADEDHIAPDVLQAWQDAGPHRVRDAIAERLALISRNGMLHVDDAEVAAAHLVQLTAGSVAALPDREPAEVVERGVDAFLAAYHAAGWDVSTAGGQQPAAQATPRAGA